MMADMIEVKAAELEGDLLDCLVATIENPAEKIFWFADEGYTLRWHYKPKPYSTDWAHGGPLLDKYRINFATTGTGPVGENGREPVVAITYNGGKAMNGPTHLIAGCRAIVAGKLGDVVRVPAALLKGGA